MAETTHIEWTDATWNPVTGCTLASEGCRHCYAAALAAGRLRHHPSRAGLARVNAAGEARFTGEVRFNEGWLDQPLRWTRPRRVFVCAHGDLFHPSVPDEWIDKVFAVMALAPRHTFQVLTKRPERARAYLERDPRDAINSEAGMIVDWSEMTEHPAWPLPNVWLGTSVEDQATADARIPHLLATPAAVRFVSAEPLLGPVDINDWDLGLCLDWVIVGGESGRGARPMHPDWARSLRDQCQRAGVPFFFKQWGAWHTQAARISTGEAVFLEFRDFNHWAAKAPTWVNGGLCLDRLGRHLRIGSDFLSARDEGRFPVTVMHRVGKARADRRLDGREWNEMPEGPAHG